MVIVVEHARSVAGTAAMDFLPIASVEEKVIRDDENGIETGATGVEVGAQCFGLAPALLTLLPGRETPIRSNRLQEIPVLAAAAEAGIERNNDQGVAALGPEEGTLELDEASADLEAATVALASMYALPAMGVEVGCGDLFFPVGPHRVRNEKPGRTEAVPPARRQGRAMPKLDPVYLVDPDGIKGRILPVHIKHGIDLPDADPGFSASENKAKCGYQKPGSKGHPRNGNRKPVRCKPCTLGA
jgi:hypothetical protein